MNKYRDKSDFEINKAVAIARGYKVMSCEESVMAYIDSGYKPFDPCNNPADAMPIILDHRISLILPGVKYDDSYSSGYAASGFDETVDGEIITKFTSFNENIFRAAMEVFLMMKDAENEK